MLVRVRHPEPANGIELAQHSGLVSQDPISACMHRSVPTTAFMWVVQRRADHAFDPAGAGSSHIDLGRFRPRAETHFRPDGWITNWQVLATLKPAHALRLRQNVPVHGL